MNYPPFRVLKHRSAWSVEFQPTDLGKEKTIAMCLETTDAKDKNSHLPPDRSHHAELRPP